MWVKDKSVSIVISEWGLRITLFLLFQNVGYGQHCFYCNSESGLRIIQFFVISECGLRTRSYRAGALHTQLPHDSGQRHGPPRHQNREEATDSKWIPESIK
jgi:hypothetical protein